MPSLQYESYHDRENRIEDRMLRLRKLLGLYKDFGESFDDLWLEVFMTYTSITVSSSISAWPIQLLLLTCKPEWGRNVKFLMKEAATIRLSTHQINLEIYKDNTPKHAQATAFWEFSARKYGSIYSVVPSVLFNPRWTRRPVYWIVSRANQPLSEYSPKILLNRPGRLANRSEHNWFSKVANYCTSFSLIFKILEWKPSLQF